jgi:hypothetical protein
MANPNEFKVEGTIKDIRKGYTRFNKPYARIRVEGPKNAIWVTVFSKAGVKNALTARIGDTVKATGSGFHTGGSIRAKGSTSLTARLFKVIKDEAARTKAAAPQPQQLALAI